MDHENENVIKEGVVGKGDGAYSFFWVVAGQWGRILFFILWD